MQAVAEADAGQRLSRALAPLPHRRTRIQEPVGDVLERRRVLGEEELLEHKSDPGRAHRGKLAVGHLGDVEPVIDTRPEVGRSSVPIRCSSVDFPEPDGPTIATARRHGH